MSLRAARCFLSVCIALIFVESCCAITVKLQPGESFCVFEEAKGGDSVDVDVAVLEGGARDIKVKAHDAGGALLLERMVFTRGRGTGLLPERLSVTPERAGVVSLCLHNDHSRHAHKVVAVDQPPPVGHLTSADVSTKLGSQLDGLHRRVRALARWTRYMGLYREHESAALLQTTALLQLLNVAQSAVVAAVCVVQAWYIRQLFNRSQVLPR